MGTPAEFRQYARDCVDLACKATSEYHRQMLLDLADKWLRLAGATRQEVELITKNQSPG